MTSRKIGFTLIEMIVVMGMIAVLSLISVSALLSSRSQATLDSMAQDIISNIRDAQNRTVSTVAGTGDSERPAKVWAYQIRKNAVTGGWDNTLMTYYPNALENGLDPQEEYTNTPFNSAATISITKDAGPSGNYGDTLNIAFASPFGRPYITNGNFLTCQWKEPGNRPAQDWFIDPECNSLVSPSSKDNSGSSIAIKISYKNMNRSIIIGASGDAYLQ